uniref:Uncharacterized protein n=1 Tax=Pipistrellus kuhlii TaxID=59472 RepID=A0A7J7XVE2_PIPKU|nr:hypothetical protein mPipKuh1_010512 [Pipistrellus kuhlii]
MESLINIFYITVQYECYNPLFINLILELSWPLGSSAAGKCRQGTAGSSGNTVQQSCLPRLSSGLLLMASTTPLNCPLHVFSHITSQETSVPRITCPLVSCCIHSVGNTNRRCKDRGREERGHLLIIFSLSL